MQIHAGYFAVWTRSLEAVPDSMLCLCADNSSVESNLRKLVQHRHTYLLFNPDRFRGHIESDYVTMREQYQRGDTAESFSVIPAI